jgi:ribonucleoside-diphosphate reductase alpha chain
LEVALLDSIQTKKGPRVEIDRSRDERLTDFGKAVLEDRYLLPEEDYQGLFARMPAPMATTMATPSASMST